MSEERKNISQVGGLTSDRKFKNTLSGLSGIKIQPRAAGASTASPSDKGAHTLDSGAFTPQLIHRLIESLKEKL